MKRGYTGLEYKSIIRKLKAARPGVSISSDFHCRIPGRDRAGFRTHVPPCGRGRFRPELQFPLQPAPGDAGCRTGKRHAVGGKKGPSRAAPGTAGGTGKQRLRKPALTRSSGFWWSVPSRRDPEELAGRASDNRVINFKGPSDLIGTFQPVRVTGLRAHSLRGDWVPAQQC